MKLQLTSKEPGFHIWHSENHTSTVKTTFYVDLNFRINNIFAKILANIDVAVNCFSSVTETLFLFFY